MTKERYKTKESRHKEKEMEITNPPTFFTSFTSPFPEQPEVWTGLEGMRLLKTTQSSFVNFVQDEFRSLPDQEDRIFSTVISAAWKYTDIDNIDFGKTWLVLDLGILVGFGCLKLV